MTRPVRGGLQVRAYEVLDRAVTDGIAYGWRRAHKHTEHPAPEVAQEEIRIAIMNEISTVFSFDEQERE